MQPQIIETDYWVVESRQGETAIIPADVCGPHGPSGDMAPFTIHCQSKRRGILWRFSAPGFLDCTEWTPADSVAGAVREMLGDTLDESDLQAIADYLPGFDEFWEGYLIALAFTGMRWDSEDSEPMPIYSNPGGCISEVVETDELLSRLDESARVELLSDCLGFFTESLELIGDEFERAGANFHFTRNGHGCGFWDGDWESGDQLSELSRPWGSCELTQYGDELTITH